MSLILQRPCTEVVLSFTDALSNPHSVTVAGADAARLRTVYEGKGWVFVGSACAWEQVMTTDTPQPGWRWYNDADGTVTAVVA